MKRLIIIAMMLAAITMQAQVHLNVGKESKAVGADALEKGTFIGRCDDNDVWVNQAKKGWQLTAFDRDIQVTQTATIEIKAERLLAATMSGNTATLLLANEDKKETKVMVAHLALDGASSVDTLGIFKMPGRKDKCTLWGARSSLGNYMGVVAVQQFRDSMEYVATAYLVSSRGNLVYSREFAMLSFDQVFVTDNGCIATMLTENTPAGVDVTVNYVTANLTSNGRASMACDPMRDAFIVNVVGNRLLGIGTTYARKKSEKVCNGLLTFAYDLDSNKVSNFEAHNFTVEEINTLYNNYVRKKQKNLVAENVSVIGTVPTTYGGALAITRAFEELKSTNDGIIHHTFKHLGILVLGVDANGGVAWSNIIRCNDNQENTGDDLRLGFMSDGDEVFVFKSESPKDVTEYDNIRAAKVYRPGKKGNLVCYAIARNGFIEKAVLERKSKQSFLLVTDDQEIFTVRGRKVRRATMSVDPAVEEPARE